MAALEPLKPSYKEKESYPLWFTVVGSLASAAMQYTDMVPDNLKNGWVTVALVVIAGLAGAYQYAVRQKTKVAKLVAEKEVVIEAGKDKAAKAIAQKLAGAKADGLPENP